MRVIFIFLLALVSTAQAQQINPVPDYIFRNQMSVGRNGVTDTAAYMSVGPRFGAVKGFMPPIVTDTNAVTGVKRNGLLIFSLQLNNFAYWDSTTARFRKITAEASVDSLIYATRAWRKKGDDSLGAIIAVKTDTGLISTKAYRQKGIDSVVTLISTLGGGTVLSVSAGTGMNFSTITTSGAVNADTAILSTRARVQKSVDSLGAIVGTKVNISDTATMLGAYLRKADTTAMIAPYLRKVDTTAMLTPYVRAAGYGLTKGTQIISADTAAMATRARVQKGIDSVSALFTSPDTLTLATRAWRQKGDDSLGAIIGTKATATGTTNYLSKFTGTSALGNSIVYATTNEIGISTSSPSEKLDVNGRVRVRTIDSTTSGINVLYSDAEGVIKKTAFPTGTGTVTSVATGFGINGGTITTTGTLTADTLNISTKAWRQKGVDSVAALANTKVNISDTATMLGAYLRKADTVTLSNRINLKLNASDTVSLSNRINLKLNISDTSSMLTNYIRHAGNGLTKTGQALSVDTASIATRARVQKAVDSLQANINAKGSGTVTSVATGYGLSGGTITTTGTLTADTLNISTRARVQKGIDSVASVRIGGTGTTNYVPKFTAASNIGNSQIFDNGTFVGIGTATPGAKFDVLHTNIAARFRSTGNPVPVSVFNTNSSVSSIGFQGSTSTNDFNVRVGADGDNLIAYTNNTERLRIFANGRVFVGASPSDAGYQLDVNGSLRNTAGANFATSSGNVGIGTESPSEKLDVDGRGRLRTIDSTSSAMNMLYADATGVIKKAAVPSGGGGSVTSVATGFGLSGGTITTTGTLIVDSAAVATRARVQKGIDSVAQNLGLYLPLTGGTLTGGLTGTTGAFTSSGSGNTFSVTHSSGSGIGVNIAKGGNGEGLYINKTSGSGNAATIIGTLNATTLVKSGGTSSQYLMADGSTSTLTNPVTGTGISGYFPKWTGSTSQDTSQIFQLGRNIGIGTATPAYRLHLPDQGATLDQSMISGMLFGSDGNGVVMSPGATNLTIKGGNTNGSIYSSAVGGVGHWGINTGTSINDAVFSVNGDVKIVTIDSTATARNMLYQDANGVIKKSAALTMSDDVMTASGSWVVTKDAGSGFSINNVAYTTNGTTKMVTIDGAFYISAELFSDASWDDVATIPSGFRPQKTVNWTNNFIVSGAEYETTGGTDFTGALSWTYAQMRVTDEGKVQINGSINTNTLDAGGGDYVVIQFTQSFIIK